MREPITLQEGVGLEEGILNIRRGSVCGNPLAEVNSGPECFACRAAKVINIGGHGKVFSRPTTFGVMSPVSLCTSCETHGFNRVYIDYHRWGKDLGKGLISYL